MLRMDSGTYDGQNMTGFGGYGDMDGWSLR